jgi:hypothetical protein
MWSSAVVEDFRKCATSRVPAVALLREVANYNLL